MYMYQLYVCTIQKYFMNRVKKYSKICDKAIPVYNYPL